MIPHDILTLYTLKAVEYFVAFGFLLFFVPFWRYAMGDAQTQLATVRATAGRHAGAHVVEWFQLARDVMFHPGHAWARVERTGAVTIGLDDFAQKLVGPVHAIDLPPVGTRVAQGEPAWRLYVDGKVIDMLSPVDGVVTDLNPQAMTSPGVVHADPYGSGWLLRVEASRFEANRKGLLGGRMAQHWMREATDALRMRMSPDLGLVLQDGGTPVDGIALAIDSDRWDEIAREFFLTQPTAHRDS